MKQMPRNHAPHTSVYLSECNHESLKAIYYTTTQRNKLLTLCNTSMILRVEANQIHVVPSKCGLAHGGTMQN
jgi:hypothetical protein